MHRALLVCGVAVTWLIGACSSSGDGTDGSGASNGSGDEEQGGLFLDGLSEDGGSGALLERDLAACAVESVATEAAPLDIYVMFDQSCSMSCPAEMAGAGLCCPDEPRPRIDQVRDAMEQFLEAPASAGIRVGLGYFGHMQPGNTSCNAAAYETPAVPFGLLPDHATELVSSLRATPPVGETPTGAALRGACSYARGWKEQHPGHTVVILLVTDGVPEAPVTQRCNPTLADAEAAAAECLGGTPGVATYVLGVGANLQNLVSLAEAGGTETAYIVDGNPEVGGAVLEALTRIRDSAHIPCDFTIPPLPSGRELDPERVNVVYGDARGREHVVLRVASQEDCAAEGGWYYDDPSSPGMVRLCERTCNRATAQLIAASAFGRSAAIDLKYGCASLERPR